MCVLCACTYIVCLKADMLSLLAHYISQTVLLLHATQSNTHSTSFSSDCAVHHWELTGLGFTHGLLSGLAAG